MNESKNKDRKLNWSGVKNMEKKRRKHNERKEENRKDIQRRKAI
jgi:hypothetical protein